MPDTVIRAADEVIGSLRAFAHPPTWLRKAAEPDRIAEAFARAVPEFATGELRLRDCEAVRLRIKDDCCSARYRVTISDGAADRVRDVELTGELIPPGRRRPEIVVRAPFGSPRWKCSLPDLGVSLATAPTLDPALPALPELTSPHRARALLESAVREGTPEYSGFRVRGCRPRVVRFKPGSRCTVVCDLDLPNGAPEEWPRTVVAKTYRGRKGETAFTGMRALWDTSLRTSASVTIAQPLAFLPERKVLLQRGIAHDCTLKELLRSSLRTRGPEAMDRLEAAVARAARGLAALHLSSAVARETVTWEDELADVRKVVARVVAVAPEIANAAGPLLAHLEEAADEHPAQSPGPAHRSFRPAQVLIDAERIGFIDFDGFCLAEPAIDVALFRATLLDIGLPVLRHPERDGAGPPVSADQFAVLDALCEQFLECYEEVAPISRTRVALWEVLYALTAVVNCWTKVKLDRLAYRMPLLLYQMRASGLEGLGV